MITKVKFYSAPFFFIFFGMTSIYAQKTLKVPRTVAYNLESKQLYYVFLKNKSKILAEFSDTNVNGDLLFKTDFSVLKINKNDIAKIELMREYILSDNPHYYKYFLGPSALGLKKGDSYVQNTYGVINSYTYSFTKHFSVSTSSTIVAYLLDGPDFAQSIVPQFSGYKFGKNWHYGAGVILRYVYNYVHMEAPFGMVTYGNCNNNITLRGGFVYINDFDSSNSDFKPFGTLSAMYRVGKHASIVSESWSLSTLDDNGPVSFLGVRFFGRNLSLDLALFYNHKFAEDESLLGPYVDLAYKF